jgi:hypothetical protein
MNPPAQKSDADDFLSRFHIEYEDEFSRIGAIFGAKPGGRTGLGFCWLCVLLLGLTEDQLWALALEWSGFGMFFLMRAVWRATQRPKPIEPASEGDPSANWKTRFHEAARCLQQSIAQSPRFLASNIGLVVVAFFARWMIYVVNVPIILAYGPEFRWGTNESLVLIMLNGLVLDSFSPFLGRTFPKLVGQWCGLRPSRRDGPMQSKA